MPAPRLQRPSQPAQAREQSARALAILAEALEAVDPAEAVRRAVRLEGEVLQVGDTRYALARSARIRVVGAGKAAASMAAALCERLGERLGGGGLVIVKHGHRGDFDDPRVEVREAGHPWTDAAGIAATASLLERLGGLSERDLVFVVVSGGGSALLEQPVPGVTLEDLQSLTTGLLRAGADIREINTVRKHVSRVKAGQLARAASPATVVSLILSDVIGAPLDAIASGPTAPDPTTYGEAWAVLERHGLVEVVPASVRRHLEAGRRGELAETPKPGDAIFARVQNRRVAGIEHAVEAAEEAARRRGFHTLLLTTSLCGEAREVAQVIAAVAREIQQQGRPLRRPAAVIAGGETTVTLRGDGKGGRNQEFALAAALAIQGLDGVLVASLATDGTDGPTDAAGAMVWGDTVARGRALDVRAEDHLARNDAYRYFDALGDLIVTGPTRTNVCDVVLALVE